MTDPRPQRIQRRRARGWRLPPNAVVVTRPSRWSNRYRVVQDRSGWWCMLTRTEGLLFASAAAARRQAVILFAEDFERDPTTVEAAIGALRGRDLACFCEMPAPGEPDHCHAAWLIARVNRPLACDAG